MKKINFSTVSLIMRLFGAILSGFLISEIAPTTSKTEACPCAAVILFYTLTCVIAVAITHVNKIVSSIRYLIAYVAIGFTLSIVFLHYGHPIAASASFLLSIYFALIEAKP